MNQNVDRIAVEPGDDFRQEVLEGLREFNEGHAGAYGLRHVRLSMRAGDGSLIAGLVGLCYWNMLYVDLLWVSPTNRRSGCGRTLLQRAEQIAFEHGCDVAYLATYSFQAPEFYRKQGYQALCTLENAPTGHSTTWFSKRLAQAQ
jgi:GNAT superfamily N-acetyltransferase